MTQVWEYIKIALMNIRSNKGRSILTMLGISQVGKLIIQGCIILAVVAAQQLWKKD